MPLPERLIDPTLLNNPMLNQLALNHRHVASSVSTNSELIDAIQDGALSVNQLHLLTADMQTAGRGQRTRSWQSPRGNVYLSLYHPMTIPVSGLLSLIVGLELAKMPIIQRLNRQLHAQGLTPIGVKWANDLGFYAPSIATPSGDIHPQNAMTINHFQKLAGILIEPVWHLGKLVGVVIGVGLNVQSTPALTSKTCEGMSYQALSLQDIVRQLIHKNVNADKNSAEHDAILLPSLKEIYVQMSRALLAAMEVFGQCSGEQGRTHTPATDTFLHEFAQQDALHGHYLRVSQNHQGQEQQVKGYAAGIDTNGCLQLRQDNGKLAALFTGRIDVIHKA